MTSFIFIYIVMSTMCVYLLSAEPEISVSGPVGSTAILPCELPSVDNDTPNIRWNTESETVFERKNGEKYERKGYEGHVDVPVEELHKRNCSLVLHNLTFTDTGVYTSYQIERQTNGHSVTKVEISRVHLTVSDRTEERPDKNPDSPGDTEKDPRYWWWILIVPGLVLLGVFVWWFLKRRKQRQSPNTDTDGPL